MQVVEATRLVWAEHASQVVFEHLRADLEQDLKQEVGRMGVNVISWLVQKLFGRSWRSYCIGPFFMAALQVPFIYLTATKLAVETQHQARRSA